MTDTELIALIKKMREAQKKYVASYRTNANYLKKAEEIEKEVDKILFPKEPDTQKKMF